MVRAIGKLDPADCSPGNPLLGVVQKGNRKITVIGRPTHALEATKRRGGSAHRRGQAGRVGRGTRRRAPEFDGSSPRKHTEGELAAAVRAARRIDAPWCWATRAAHCRQRPRRRGRRSSDATPRGSSRRRTRRACALVRKPSSPLVLMSSASTSRERWRLDPAGAAAALRCDQRRRRSPQRGDGANAPSTRSTRRSSRQRRTPSPSPRRLVSARVADVLLVARDDRALRECTARAGARQPRPMGVGTPPLSLRHGSGLSAARGRHAPFFGQTETPAVVPHAPVVAKSASTSGA